MIITPPKITLEGGISFKNSHTHKGPQRVSISINNPTVAEVIDLEPIVIQINPNDSCGTPNRNPMKMS